MLIETTLTLDARARLPLRPYDHLYAQRATAGRTTEERPALRRARRQLHIIGCLEPRMSTSIGAVAQSDHRRSFAV